MPAEQRASERPAGQRRENVERNVGQRPGPGDDHGYNSGADGDDRNGNKHARAKYHDRDPAGSLRTRGSRGRSPPASPPCCCGRAIPGRCGRPRAAPIGDSLLLACALVAVDRVLMAYRWLTLLAPLEPEYAVRRLEP